MTWKIVTVECFDNWFLGLDAAEQKDVLAAIFILEHSGRRWAGHTLTVSRALTR